jgi:hypothetical protein
MILEEQDVEKIAQELVKIIQINLGFEAPDQLLNKTELAKKLRCDIRNLDEMYIYQQGFPKIIPAGEGNKQPRFSQRAVDKWIEENQIYHQARQF